MTSPNWVADLWVYSPKRRLYARVEGRHHHEDSAKLPLTQCEYTFLTEPSRSNEYYTNMYVKSGAGNNPSLMRKLNKQVLGKLLTLIELLLYQLHLTILHTFKSEIEPKVA